MENFPPLPSDNPRRLRLHPLQWIGVPIMILLPVLALFGVFGREESVVHSASTELMLEVRYSSLLRYKQSNPLVVTVTNISGRPLNHVSVSCDSAYFAAYDNLMFIPEAQRPYVVPVGALAPGERFRIRIDGQPEERGGNTGYITARTDGGKPATVMLKTFVFP